MNFKTMNKIIKTAVVNKLENVKYTCQINYTFLKKNRDGKIDWTEKGRPIFLQLIFLL